MNTADYCGDCPVKTKKAGCGYIVVGQPCGHPKRREEWERREEINKAIAGICDICDPDMVCNGMCEDILALHGGIEEGDHATE